jgi:hypothetical protein
MAKHDWSALQSAFLADHAESGITAQEWCEQHGLNYQSARRYIKPRAAQSAQSDLRKTAHSAQSKGTAHNCAKGKKGKEGEKKKNAGTNRDTSDSSPDGAKLNGRDSAGRFTEGNPGNPNAVSPFVPGNDYAAKHRGYAKYLNADGLFDDASLMRLEDELVFVRARALSVTQTMKKIHEDLDKTEDIGQRLELYGKFLAAEQALDRNIARIESVNSTISKLRIDKVAEPRLVADTYRIKAATAKLTAETQKLTTENQGVTTPLTGVVNELREDNQDGIL